MIGIKFTHEENTEPNMLYYVKYKLKKDKVKELADAMKSGAITKKAKHIFTPLKDSFTGLSFWEVENEDDIKTVLDQLKQYTDIVESMEVVSAGQIQEDLLNKLEENRK